MSTLTWVLVGVAIYWMALLALRNRGLLPGYVGTQGPIVTLHTKRGRQLLDRLSSPRRFWRALSNVGVGVAIVVMAVSFVFLLVAAISSLYSPQETAVTQPRNVLVIPGVNEFLPLSVAPEIVFGLLVGLVAHEGAHGLLCRVEDIEIESMGLALFAIVPIGAFVEPDEESQKSADRGGKTRMFAAGVTANFLVTIVAFGLLFGPVTGSIAVAPGAAIGGAFPGSPADEAGIEAGDRITAFEGEPVEDNEDLEAKLDGSDDPEVSVTVNDEREVPVERSLLVVGAVRDGPAGIATNTTIVAVNGTSVHTQAGFDAELRDRTVVTVETADGDEHTFPAGAYAPVVSEDGPAAQAGVPTDENATVIITAIDGERVMSTDDLTGVLRGTEPGQTVAVEAYVDGEPETYDVELGEHDRGHGLLGIATTPGVTGLTISDFGTQAYPADAYLAMLGGGEDDTGGPVADTFVGQVFAALMLPLASVVNIGLPFNFAGFTGFVTNFYTVEGALSVLGTGAFLLANALFWTGWINLNLAFFNCIPAFPLDGGHILRTGTEAIFARLPFPVAPELTKTVTVTIGLTMLASLLVMIFGQGLLV